MLDENFGTPVLNGTDVPTDVVYQALETQDRALVQALAGWVQSSRLTAYNQEYDRRNGGIFMRDRYVAPARFFDQMRLAYTALESDDIVAGVAESTESLAFSGMSFFAADEDEQDVYNQMAGRIDLDSRMREIWRELFAVSQCYIGVWSSQQTFKIRGKTKEGVQRKKTITCVAPEGMTLLDPLKIIPVGLPMFGKEQLAYIATNEEHSQFMQIVVDPTDSRFNDRTRDAIVERFIVGRYIPNRIESAELATLGVNPASLWLLDPNNVFYHSLTRPGYSRVAPIRMRSVFELLDLKQQLRQMERAHLIGAPLRADQRVPTPQGWKPIGAVEVGDEVYSVDGQTTRIIGVFPQGVLPMYRVTFTDGAEVYCDKSHPWTVRDRRGRERTITLGQIMAEGLHDSNGDGSVHRHRIPVAEPLDLPEVELPLDPYLLGYLIGNGSLSQAIPKITSAEGEFIPDTYLWAAAEQRWSLLQGLCDSDGSVGVAGVVEYSTVSEKLAAQVVQLAQSLGCLAKAALQGKHENKGLHRVTISVRQEGQPFRLGRKAAAWRPRRHPLVRAIKSIGRSLDAEAVCIKTDRDDGLFLTEGMVVTHNTNFIVIITKGSDELPARPEEIANLQTMVKTVARVPILIGDHRLHVEIVTPKVDNTLRAERHNTIDSRITARLYQMFMLGNYAAGAGGDDSVKLVKVIARGMESRRHMIRRSLERNIFRPMFEGNEQLTSMPKLQFHPRSIALDFDAAWASFLFDLRQANELSRETILSQFDLSQELEAELRKREKEQYDDIFRTQVPFSSPNPALPPQPGTSPENPPPPPPPSPEPPPDKLPRDNGGGRRRGGGAAPGTGQGQAPRRRPKP
jgi:hypothetical protein